MHDETLHTALTDVAMNRVVWHPNGPSSGWRWGDNGQAAGPVPQPEYDALQILLMQREITVPARQPLCLDRTVVLTPHGQRQLNGWDAAHRAGMAGAR
jgi:hypothetical protein